MTNAGAAGRAAPAPYYVVFDVDVRDALRYGEYMAHVLPQIEAAGGKYLARGGPHTVYEGDWSPYRLVLLEFPSREAFEGFYHSPAYQDLHALRDEVSYARMVGVEGLPYPGAAAAATLAPLVLGGPRPPTRSSTASAVTAHASPGRGTLAS